MALAPSQPDYPAVGLQSENLCGADVTASQNHSLPSLASPSPSLPTSPTWPGAPHTHTAARLAPSLLSGVRLPSWPSAPKPSAVPKSVSISLCAGVLEATWSRSGSCVLTASLSTSCRGCTSISHSLRLRAAWPGAALSPPPTPTVVQMFLDAAVGGVGGSHPRAEAALTFRRPPGSHTILGGGNEEQGNR